MTQPKTRKLTSATREVKPNEIWSEEKMSKFKKYILAKSKKQSPEQKLRNELLAIKFRLQDYSESIDLHGK